MSESTPEEWVLDEVDQRVEPNPDGVQNTQSNVWTSRRRLRNDGRKSSTPHDADAVVAAIDDLLDRGDLLSWHGLLAPTDDEHLRAIIGNENAADITRTSLLESCRELLSAEDDGGASA